MIFTDQRGTSLLEKVLERQQERESGENKENCQDGYWEQLRTVGKRRNRPELPFYFSEFLGLMGGTRVFSRQKYREREGGERDRSGPKKMAGRPIRVCNGGRESVCPSVRSSGSFHDQFESGDPGMRYLQSMVFEPKPREWFISVVCTNRGRVLMDSVA